MSTPGRFLVDPDDPRPLYVQIMDEVRRAVVTGALEAGDALPSVRELSGELRLNPNTVQQAYRELERDGLVFVRRGQGTFVAPSIEEDAVRAQVLRRLGDAALREALRSGVTPSELIHAIRQAEARLPPSDPEDA